MVFYDFDFELDDETQIYYESIKSKYNDREYIHSLVDLTAYNHYDYYECKTNLTIFWNSILSYSISIFLYFIGLYSYYELIYMYLKKKKEYKFISKKIISIKDVFRSKFDEKDLKNFEENPIQL